MSAYVSRYVRKVMTYKSIPPGQFRLYKPLFLEVGGLTLQALSRASDCDEDDTKRTLGGLGKRVTEALGGVIKRPSRLLIRRDEETGKYTLSPTLRKFITNTPSLQKVLQDSPMEMFFLRSKTAWEFQWEAGGKEGQLKEFERGDYLKLQED